MIKLVKKTNRSPNALGVIHFPKEYIGKRVLILRPYEITKLNKCYWFLRKLQADLNKVKFLKGDE